MSKVFFVYTAYMKKSLIIITTILVFIWIYISSVLHIISWPWINKYWHIRLYDAKWRLIVDKWLSEGYMIPYTWTLTGKLFESIIFIEDKRFYEHGGIDLRAKIGALKENISAWKVVRGWSTITEQYLKNTYFRESERNLKQKIDEAIAAIWIEMRYSKDEIFRKYMDNIYFWNNTYGIAGALELYFPWKSVTDLTDTEILDIITRIHSPNTWSSYHQWYKWDIAKKLWWDINSKDLTVDKKRTSLDRYPIITERIVLARNKYCSWDIQELQKWTYKIPDNICSSNSLSLNLSIKLELQYFIHEVMQKNLIRVEKENVTGGAVYVYDPSNNKVLAYIGNRWVSSENWAIDMITRRRSVGSILKPFVYLLALKEWAELESLILDDLRNYPTWIEGKSFVPQNYNPQSYGPVRLREALGNSLNSSTVRISEKLWIWFIYNFFEEVGLSMNHDAWYYGYGISLGGVELSLENIVESYSYLTHIEDPNIFLIHYALSESKNRAKTFWISSILNSSLNLPVKTGTSTDFRDNWAVSYHQDAIIGVWVGNANGSPMEEVTWVTWAWPIWHTIAEYMIQNWYIKNEWLRVPSTVKETLLCLEIKCLQKERTYMKNPVMLNSRPKSNIYDSRDFIWILTEEEKKKWNIK